MGAAFVRQSCSSSAETGKAKPAQKPTATITRRSSKWMRFWNLLAISKCSVDASTIIGTVTSNVPP